WLRECFRRRWLDGWFRTVCTIHVRFTRRRLLTLRILGVVFRVHSSWRSRIRRCRAGLRHTRKRHQKKRSCGYTGKQDWISHASSPERSGEQRDGGVSGAAAGNFLFRYFAPAKAVISISTRAPIAKPFTPSAERAGRRSCLKYST